MNQKCPLKVVKYIHSCVVASSHPLCTFISQIPSCSNQRLLGIFRQGSCHEDWRDQVKCGEELWPWPTAHTELPGKASTSLAYDPFRSRSYEHQLSLPAAPAWNRAAGSFSYPMQESWQPCLQFSCINKVWPFLVLRKDDVFCITFSSWKWTMLKSEDVWRSWNYKKNETNQRCQMLVTAWLASRVLGRNIQNTVNEQNTEGMPQLRGSFRCSLRKPALQLRFCLSVKGTAQETTLLRSNLHAIKCIWLEYTLWWILAKPCVCVTIMPISL